MLDANLRSQFTFIQFKYLESTNFPFHSNFICSRFPLMGVADSIKCLSQIALRKEPVNQISDGVTLVWNITFEKCGHG